MMADYIRNRSTCLRMKLVQPSRLQTPLNETSPTTIFPGELIQTDILKPLLSSPYMHALTAIDVLSKNLSAVPLTTVIAPSPATALNSVAFQHSYIPQEIQSNL